MKYRVHGGNLHVHQCPEHPEGCEYFADHALLWMLGNREEAKDQLLRYRKAIVARIAALTVTLGFVDQLLARLNVLRPI